MPHQEGGVWVSAPAQRAEERIGAWLELAGKRPDQSSCRIVSEKPCSPRQHLKYFRLPGNWCPGESNQSVCGETRGWEGRRHLSCLVKACKCMSDYLKAARLMLAVFSQGRALCVCAFIPLPPSPRSALCVGQLINEGARSYKNIVDPLACAFLWCSELLWGPCGTRRSSPCDPASLLTSAAQVDLVSPSSSSFQAVHLQPGVPFSSPHPQGSITAAVSVCGIFHSFVYLVNICLL